MTEDEIEEKSFKAILPSESHRKRAKKHHLDNMSVTSDEGSGKKSLFCSHFFSFTCSGYVPWMLKGIYG
jgi:hypothetical protein